MKRICKLISNYMGVLVLVAALAGLLFPDTFSRVEVKLTYSETDSFHLFTCLYRSKTWTGTSKNGPKRLHGSQRWTCMSTMEKQHWHCTGTG